MADYIPITDQEIEPEAPLTSILHHKLRDNPIAIAEGSPGAPVFTVWAESIQFETWERVFTASFADNFTIGGGYLAFGHTYDLDGGAAKNSFFMGNANAPQGVNSVRYIEYSFTVSPQNLSYYIYYFASKPTNLDAWLFIKRDIISQNIESIVYQPHHPSFGFSSFVDHPFTAEDMTGKEIFLANLSKSQVDSIKLGTIPKVGGGYFNEQDVLDDVVVDFLSSKRSFISSMLSKYSFNFNDIQAWNNIDKFEILTKEFNVHGNGFLKAIIPEPPDVTRISVSLL